MEIKVNKLTFNEVKICSCGSPKAVALIASFFYFVTARRRSRDLRRIIPPELPWYRFRRVASGGPKGALPLPSDFYFISPDLFLAPAVFFLSENPPHS